MAYSYNGTASGEKEGCTRPPRAGTATVSCGGSQDGRMDEQINQMWSLQRMNFIQPKEGDTRYHMDGLQRYDTE